MTYSRFLRFRTNIYVIAADVEKMFRQILITPKQRSLHRILWRLSSENPVEIFELNTVISAPYLAI